MHEPVSNHRKSKRSQILVISLITAMVGGLFLFMFLNREPVYQGRSLTEWLIQLDKPKTSPEFQEARAAIHAMGKQAIPHLLPLLYLEGKSWKQTLLVKLRLQDFAKLETLHVNKRLRLTLEAFKALEDKAAPAIPTLMSWIEDPKGVPRKRLVAITTLRELGPLAKDAVPAIIGALGDSDPQIRYGAAFALGKIKHLPQVAVPALIKCLDDPHPIVRGNAIGSLIAFEKEATEAIPALERALKDSSPNVSSLAKLALQKIRP